MRAWLDFVENGVLSGTIPIPLDTSGHPILPRVGDEVISAKGKYFVVKKVVWCDLETDNPCVDVFAALKE